jgi:hypothetical protein
MVTEQDRDRRKPTPTDRGRKRRGAVDLSPGCSGYWLRSILISSPAEIGSVTATRSL